MKKRKIQAKYEINAKEKKFMLFLPHSISYWCQNSLHTNKNKKKH